MEKVVLKFATFEEADQADRLFYAGLSHEDCLRILIELRDRAHPDTAERGLARVYRVIELERS